MALFFSPVHKAQAGLVSLAAGEASSQGMRLSPEGKGLALDIAHLLNTCGNAGEKEIRLLRKERNALARQVAELKQRESEPPCRGNCFSERELEELVARLQQEVRDLRQASADEKKQLAERDALAFQQSITSLPPEDQARRLAFYRRMSCPSLAVLLDENKNLKKSLEEKERELKDAHLKLHTLYNQNGEQRTLQALARQEVAAGSVAAAAASRTLGEMKEHCRALCITLERVENENEQLKRLFLPKSQKIEQGKVSATPRASLLSFQALPHFRAARR